MRTRSNLLMLVLIAIFALSVGVHAGPGNSGNGEGIPGKVAQLETAVLSLGSGLSALKGTVADLAGTVSGIQGALADLSGVVSDQGAKITSLDDTVSDIGDDLAALDVPHPAVRDVRHLAQLLLRETAGHTDRSDPLVVFLFALCRNVHAALALFYGLRKLRPSTPLPVVAV